MSFDESTKLISVPGNADLSAKQFFFGKISNSSGTGRVAVAGNGEDAAGVIYEGASVAGVPCALAVGGVVKVKTADAITAGGNVSSDANGNAVPTATGDKVLGIALMTAASGDVIPMLWRPIG